MKQLSIQIDLKNIRNKLLNYSRQFDTCFFYDSNAELNPRLPFSYRSYDFLVALGTHQIVNVQTDKTFNCIEKFQQNHHTWLFGYLAYDIKNEIENLTSHNDDFLALPHASFVEPQIVLAVNGINLEIILIDDCFVLQSVADDILGQSNSIEESLSAATIHAKTSQEEYIQAFQEFQKQIAYGNIYEVNYCIAFETELKHQNWIALYAALNDISKAPFSAFVKLNEAIIICASPERFLKREGNKLVSQPIKGTAKRGANVVEDEQQKINLLNNHKERSENVMITDLVRNDLSKNAARNSVKVEELFGIYAFKQVHQMISTVTATLDKETNYLKAIEDAFPMGSMTGAPKIMAMKLIEQQEQMKRGLYAGALGYIDPDNNYDFNVLIRSIIINATNNKAQFCVGSAITAKANAEAEYQECLLKAQAIFKVLA